MAEISSMRKMLLTIFLVSLVTSIFFVFFSNKYPGNYSGYQIHARNLLLGNGLSLAWFAPYQPDFYRAPGYSFFLYFIYKLFGINNFIVKLIQTVMNNLFCVGIFYLSKKVFGKKIAFYSALAAAIYPFSAFFAAVIVSEVFSAFLLIFSILVFQKGMESSRKMYFMLSGLILGWGILTRPVLSGFLIFMSVGYLINPKCKSVLMNLVVFYLSTLLIWTPWIMRNYFLSGEFIPLTIEGGEMLYMSSAKDKFYAKSLVESQSKDIYGIEKIRQEKLYFHSAFLNIGNNTGSYLISSLKRLPSLWVNSVTENIPGGRWSYNSIRFFMAIVLFLGGYGIWVARYCWKESFFILMPPLYFTLAYIFLSPDLTYLFISTEERLILAVKPFLLIFAVFGLFNILGIKYDIGDN